MFPIRTSTKAVIIEAGKVLMTRCQNEEDGVFYLLPGGGQEHGELLDEALRRECLEEIGCRVRVGPLLFVRDYIARHHGFHCGDPDLHQLELYFRCSLMPGAEPKNGAVPDDMQLAVEWIPLERLDEIQIFPGGLRRALRDPEDVPAYWGEDL